jgi:hypothetical protein
VKNPAAIRDFINEGRAPTPWTEGFKGRARAWLRQDGKLTLDAGKPSMGLLSSPSLRGNRGGNGTSGRF